MGLDQYAWAREREEENNPQAHDHKFVWRKHAKLQEFMEQKFVEKTGDSAVDLNCGQLELDAVDIAELERKMQTNQMPRSQGGFFYGHQFQDESEEEYKDQDIAFVEWAKAELEKGNKVIYSCWW